MTELTNIYERLNQWYHNNLGRTVLLAEQYELEKILPNFFGYYLVQLGGPLELNWLSSSPIKYHVRYCPSIPKNASKNSVRGSFYQLSFYTESIDVILMPHILELTENPEVILKEAIDVLMPDGHIIILGFNPMSLWGMWWLAKHKRKNIPWIGHFHRIGLVRHWLSYFDCEIETLETFFFRPPYADLERRQKMRIFETIGQSCWPWLGGLYMISARKRVMGMRPIKIRCPKPAFLANKDVAASGRMENDKIC